MAIASRNASKRLSPAGNNTAGPNMRSEYAPIVVLEVTISDNGFERYVVKFYDSKAKVS